MKRGYLIGGGYGSKGLVVYDKENPKVKQMINSGKYKAHYATKEGKPFSDVWKIPFLNPVARERLGYPTQKPLSLLNRLITIFSKENDIVADFFCGCGTAIDAAQSLNRRWIGFDASETACEVMQKRMEDRHSLFIGINKKPITYEEFKNLGPFKFEKAAVRYIWRSNP